MQQFGVNRQEHTDSQRQVDWDTPAAAPTPAPAAPQLRAAPTPVPFTAPSPGAFPPAAANTPKAPAFDQVFPHYLTLSHTATLPASAVHALVDAASLSHSMYAPITTSSLVVSGIH